jgi:putative FmdB family regulatory protein
MPIIEFVCTRCGAIAEIITKSTEEAISRPQCKKCDRPMAKVEYPRTSFQLKGKWYKTSKSY